MSRQPAKKQATEQASLATALARVPVAEAFLGRLLARMRPFFPLDPPARVLDVGAAQGVSIAAFRRRGFDARGVEPWSGAIDVSRDLSERLAIELPIAPGTAEELPFPDGSFEFVQAYSVMEHVDDPWLVFREVHRVLAPGGAFFFGTTSALCPKQAEIAGFPLFPWYPDRVRRRIMKWATEQRPALVGHTTRPAYLWFKHREVRTALRVGGFAEVVDRWQLRREEPGGLRRVAVRACSRRRAVRLLGDLATPGMEYLAIKPG